MWCYKITVDSGGLNRFRNSPSNSCIFPYLWFNGFHFYYTHLHLVISFSILHLYNIFKATNCRISVAVLYSIYSIQCRIPHKKTINIKLFSFMVFLQFTAFSFLSMEYGTAITSSGIVLYTAWFWWYHISLGCLFVLCDVEMQGHLVNIFTQPTVIILALFKFFQKYYVCSVLKSDVKYIWK